MSRAKSRWRRPRGGPGCAVIANPGADVYGSDLQMLESVDALIASGWTVRVVMPDRGPLTARVIERGASVDYLEFPVLRRTDQSPRRMLLLLVRVVRHLIPVCRYIRWTQADLVYVNTTVIPWWLLAARLMRTPTVCHVHEAESGDRLAARLAIYGPLLLADSIIMISSAAMRAATTTNPFIRRRSTIVRNGVPARPEHAELKVPGPRIRLGVVARLSPRKGTADALESVAILRARGRDVVLDLFGTTFAGYEWYERELADRASKADLVGAVVFHGYTSPVWQAFDSVDIVLAPAHVEPSGNAVVEAQYSLRPVVASRAEGHLESIAHEESGLLVGIGRPGDMADAVERLIDDPVLADRIAKDACETAIKRNSVVRYRQLIMDVIQTCTSGVPRTSDA